MKKIVSVFLAFMIVVSMFSTVTITASAYSVPDEAGFAAKLNSLRAQFPNGGYYSGTYYENGTAKAWECHGYALECFEQVFGIQYYNSGFYNRRDYTMGTIYAGDVVRVSNDSHTIFITKVEGDRIYYTEANYWPQKYGRNYVRWDQSYTYSALRAIFTYKVHVPENYLRGIPISFTPVDLGTNFYAFIINVNAWKHLTVDSNVNITIRSEKAGKSPDQVFRFERQADGSYKIISTANGWCLDVNGASSASGANVSVCGSNDSDAQRWYIYGSSGEYRLKAKCTDCWLDTYGASVNDGTNVHMYSTSFENAQKFQIWSLENRPEAANIGDGFTAPILNTKSWITLENNDGNLILNKEVGKSHQLWKFQRNLDGSYTIYSCLDGKCINLHNFLHANGTNINVVSPNNTEAQRWYIYYNGRYCEIQSKESGKFFDVAGGSFTSGANIQAYTWNGSDYQRFNIYGGNECKIKSPTLTVATNDDFSNVVFERSEVYGETGYNLKIWKDEIWKGEAFSIIENVDKETTLVLPAGTYQAYVDAYNYYDIKMSNIVTFTIENNPLLGDVDGDGAVTIIDATYIQRHLANIPIPFVLDETIADTDEDGSVTIMDVTYIQRWVVKLKQ